MSHQWNAERWVQNEDGSYSRNRSAGLIAAVEEGYAAMTKEQLSEELDSRGLAKSGTKAELIARLEEADSEA